MEAIFYDREKKTIFYCFSDAFLPMVRAYVHFSLSIDL
jgi:hypothetical protein